MNNAVKVLPEDEHNSQLLSNVHPKDWKNPDPAPQYNLVVIGAGPAGLVTAAGAAGLGAKVALVERRLVGGDCLNVGCVPSKCIIRSSRVVHEIRKAREFGILLNGDNVKVDFSAVMERMRRLRAQISRHDSVKRFQELGIDIFLGNGSFSGPETLEVDGKTLHFQKAVISAGARAAQPNIEGLAEAGYLTNETVFNLTERPPRLAVIGAGPLGCELAQAFCRLGCEVTLLHKYSRIMNKEDADAAEIIQQQLVRDGLHLELEYKPQRVVKNKSGKIIYFEKNGREHQVTVDEILVGAGRAPNVEGLNLEAAGVKYGKRTGVEVNDWLHTSNPRIYAAGDVCLKYKFTHTADAAARIVIENALFQGRKRLSDLVVPWCTYTDPEVAHVGLSEREAEDKGIPVDIFKVPLADIDRAIADGEEDGFVKALVKKGTDKILGATIVARHAGEMLSEFTLAMVGNLGLKQIANVIHPYPTQSEAIKHTADMYSRTRLTPFVKSLINVWLTWRR